MKGVRVFKCDWEGCDAETSDPIGDGFEHFGFLPPDHRQGRVCRKHADEFRQLWQSGEYLKRHGDPIDAGVERAKVQMAVHELRDLKPTTH